MKYKILILLSIGFAFLGLQCTSKSLNLIGTYRGVKDNRVQLEAKRLLFKNYNNVMGVELKLFADSTYTHTDCSENIIFGRWWLNSQKDSLYCSCSYYRLKNDSLAPRISCSDTINIYSSYKVKRNNLLQYFEGHLIELEKVED